MRKAAARSGGLGLGLGLGSGLAEPKPKPKPNPDPDPNPNQVELDGRLSPSHWRTSHALLSAFAVLVRCLDPAVLHAQLLPLLLRHTAPAAPAPNRQLAVRLL